MVTLPLGQLETMAAVISELRPLSYPPCPSYSQGTFFQKPCPKRHDGLPGPASTRQAAAMILVKCSLGSVGATVELKVLAEIILSIHDRKCYKRQSIFKNTDEKAGGN